VKLRRIITFTKRLRKKLKIKKIRTKLKNIIHQFGLNDEIKNQQNFYKGAKKKSKSK
jgi:hypothetical protein